MESKDLSAVETLVANFIDYLERISETVFAIYMADPDIKAIFDVIFEARKANSPKKKKRRRRRNTLACKSCF